MIIQGDNNLENSDWIKARTWDLPYENLEQYLRNYAPADQREAVRHLMELPAFKAAPPVFRVEAEMFVAGSALKFVNGEFVVQRNTTNTVIGRNDVDGVTYITVGVRGNG